MSTTAIRVATLGAIALVAQLRPLHAALTTTPYLFTSQAAPSTGRIEWDEFMAPSPGLGPHAPDAPSTGYGAAALTASAGGVLTSTRNIYSLGNAVEYTIALSGLTNAAANTTVVLQFAAQGAFDVNSILLDGAAPTSVVDRGFASAKHGPNQTTANTAYYWAEWQTAAASSYTLKFGHPANHISLAQARVDYFNSAAPFDAVAAAAVPEPASLALVAGGAACLVRRRRR